MKITIDRNAQYNIQNMTFECDKTEIIENVIDINFDYRIEKKYDEENPYNEPKKAILIFYRDSPNQTALSSKYIYLFEKDSIHITE